MLQAGQIICAVLRREPPADLPELIVVFVICPVIAADPVQQALAAADIAAVCNRELGRSRSHSRRRDIRSGDGRAGHSAARTADNSRGDHLCNAAVIRRAEAVIHAVEQHLSGFQINQCAVLAVSGRTRNRINRLRQVYNQHVRRLIQRHGKLRHTVGFRIKILIHRNREHALLVFAVKRAPENAVCTVRKHAAVR